MRDVMTLGAAVLASVAGMGWLALPMEAHWRQVHGERPLSRATAILLRCLGAAALAGSLLVCLRTDHPSMAVLVWIMTLSCAALAVALVLSWRPRWMGLLLLRL